MARARSSRRHLIALVTLAVIGLAFFGIGLGTSAEENLDPHAKWLAYSMSIRKDPGCVLYLTFEELLPNGKVKNLASGQNSPGYQPELYDAQPQNKLALTAGAGRLPGKPAIVLDGEVHDYFLTVAHGPGICPPKQMTWEIWFKPQQSDAPWQLLIAKFDKQEFKRTRHEVCPDKRINFNCLQLASDVGNEANRPLFTKTAVSPGVWYHSVFTYDGKIVHGYLNGVEESWWEHPLHAENDRIDWGDHDLCIGGLAGRPGAGLVGVIDEMAIYDRALTLDEIKAHYAKGKP